MAPDPASPEAYLNRELSWLAFARRVLAQVADPELPLLERIKFAGIHGMLHDEFFMKRMSGLKRRLARASQKTSLDGRSPEEEYDACRRELKKQVRLMQRLLRRQLRPELLAAGIPIRDHDELESQDRENLRRTFTESILPILTPLAVDAAHPFPFISNLGLNLAAILPEGDVERFVRIKVPDNRPRWVALPEGRGYVPLEQVIAANLDLLFPESPPKRVHAFRVTRGAEGDPEGSQDLPDGDADRQPGSIVQLVSRELKARRFAGSVRLQIQPDMPGKLRRWLTRRLELRPSDVFVAESFLGLSDLLAFDPPGRTDLRYPAHEPVTHPRLTELDDSPPERVFDEIRASDLLLHHPYHAFDSSVLRFLQAAAADPQVLAIKLTIYRTSRDSPIVLALADAARRGKQVAVLVEITARFDEAPNIAWGQFLEREGAHVSYGVEKLKTHVKLALVVREEPDGLRRYAHVGTGNYHTRTARLYEDLGLLTCHPEICDDVSHVFNQLTGAISDGRYRRMLVAPTTMRRRFVELIRREAEHASAGRASGIDAKMNQLQDPELIGELYAASEAGVPVRLNVRGLCCLRPGVPGLSETIRVFGVVGRFLEHSRIYRFENGGDPEFFIGSADWMKRNLSNRVETIVPVLDPSVRAELQRILATYHDDNASAWDCDATGQYHRRRPGEGEPPRAAQDRFIERARTRAPLVGV